MGLLADVFSAIDSKKRALRGLLDDPMGAIDMAVNRAHEDFSNMVNTQSTAYPWTSAKPQTSTPQQVAAAQQQLADMGANMGMAGATVWHGSPHKFDKFDSSKIGTGEGAQAYGHGLYLADNKDVATRYRDTLTNFRPDHIEAKLIESGVSPEMANTYAQFAAQKQGGARAFEDFQKVLSEKSPSPYIEQFREKLRAEMPKTQAALDNVSGSLYKVDLPDEHIAKMLDWDKPLSQQHPDVQSALKMLDPETWHPSSGDYDANELGQSIYQRLMNQSRDGAIAAGRNSQTTLGASQASASEDLRSFGIPGIRYLDGGSRGTGSGTSNFVVFPGNEGLLSILERNGQALK